HYIPIGEEITTSDGTVLKTDYSFVFNKPSLSNAEIDLLNKNALYLPLRTELYEGGELLSSRYTQYNNTKWPGLNLPDSILYGKGYNEWEPRIIFHDYHPEGKIKEVSKGHGACLFYIWGYNGQYPIAKIEKSTLTGITAAQQVLIDLAVDASNNDSDQVSENALRTELADLRNGFPGSHVTTYTYDPLIGITSFIDSKGLSTF